VLEAYPDGPVDGRIATVAARPGKHEVGLCQCPASWHAKGIGLVGPSGHLWWKLLGKYGLSRAQCYTTNVRKDFSATHSVPTDSEIEEVLGQLKAELENTSANIIVALGREALYALCGKQSIEQWRGSILESTLLPGRKVVATWHPAAALRTPQWTYVIDADLRRAVEQSAFPNIIRPRYKFNINPNLDEAIHFVRSLRDEVTIDVETFGEEVACLGFGDSENEATCVPFINGQMTVEQLATFWKIFDEEIKKRGVIGQNVQFDIDKLERHGFQIPQIAGDTMLRHHLLWPELGMARKGDDGTEKFSGSHDLAFITSVYTEQPYYKHLAGEWRHETPVNWQKFWEYNCLDVVVTHKAYIEMGKELDECDQRQYYDQFVNRLIRPVLRMQRRGILVDKNELMRACNRIDLETALLQLRLNIDSRVQFECNVKSNIDLGYLISEKLRVGRMSTTKTGKAKTDKDTLLTYAFNSQDADIFRLILDIRERRTLRSSFFHMEADDDGRYKAYYKIHGTDSGRLSSVGPGRITGRKGPQLQNVPKAARKVFIARPGCFILSSDLRRAEAMFVAYDADDRGLIDTFNDPGRDLYLEEARYALGRSDITKESPERDVFKQVVHAANYGMGPFRLISLLRVKGIYIENLEVRGISSPMKKAEFFINSYFDRHPKLLEWQEATWEEAKRTRILYDALGRRRVFLGRKDDHMKRVTLSFRPQSTITSITNQAVITLDEAGWEVIFQVHDSVGIEVEEERVIECAAAVEDALKRPIELRGGTMIISTDTQYGKSWGELNHVVAEDVLRLYRESRSTGAVPLVDRSVGAERSTGT
jgi:uracil-DNA glycosylase family 4